jgi:hypothetical protein
LGAWVDRVQATHPASGAALPTGPVVGEPERRDAGSRGTSERLSEYAEAVRAGEAMDEPDLTGGKRPAAPLILVLDASEL